MSKKFQQRLVGLVAMGAAVAAPASALGYCRTMSCELGEEQRIADTGEGCERDAGGCVTEGQPLHWASPCIDYAVQLDGSAKLGIDADQLQQVVADAFSAWENVECPGGGSPRFHARFQGFVSCARREAVCGDASVNVNVIMFHDELWTEAANAIALTTPSGGVSSGLIIDADLEINSARHAFSLDGAEPDTFRLPDVLAHELGHFLGLGHSEAPGALMAVDYASLLVSRELLTPDDVAAICAAYPPGAALECGAPASPAYDECQRQPGVNPPCTLKSMTHDNDDGGCTMARAPGARGYSWLWLLAPLAFGRRAHSRSGSKRQQGVDRGPGG